MDNDYIKRVSWEDVGSYLNAVAERIDPHDFSGVYGVPRGGSVLGAWLSHKLYLPLLSQVEPNCIIVDDVCDGGHALKKVLDTMDVDTCQHCFVTVMFYNPESVAQVDYHYKEKDDNWIAFPWEQ